jgi:hypothetical protein
MKLTDDVQWTTKQDFISIRERHPCTIYIRIPNHVLRSMIFVRPNFLIFLNSHISELWHSTELSAAAQTQITCAPSFWLSFWFMASPLQSCSEHFFLDTQDQGKISFFLTFFPSFSFAAFRLSRHPCHLIILFLTLHVLHLQFNGFSRGRSHPKTQEQMPIQIFVEPLFFLSVFLLPDYNPSVVTAPTHVWISWSMSYRNMCNLNWDSVTSARSVSMWCLLTLPQQCRK